MANSNPITADMRPTLDLNKFRFWCQKVLPLVYDDSISYYEVLGKMVVYLNQVIDNVNADTENVLTLKEAFDELKEYVDSIADYDIEELEEKLAQAIHAAEMATEAEVIVQGYANSASESANNANASAINAANAATIASNSSSSAAESAQNASTSAINAANSALNAINMAESASASAATAEQAAASASGTSTSAEADALKAEGYAVGQQNGSDVSSSSPYYHKNAKYYAEQAGQGAGAYPLADLPDTQINNPEQGQVLAYDATLEKWVNSDDVEGVTSLEALTDTDINSPTGGQTLVYNQSTEKWENAEQNEIAVSPTAPSSPDTKMWINTASQTPVLLPTMADVQSVQTQVTNNTNDIASLTQTVNGKADSSAVSTALASKADKTAFVTRTSPTALTVADNTEYYLNSVTELTISFPSGRFECWIRLATTTSFRGITFPSSAMYIGGEPDFAANERWEVSIKNDVVVAGKVE